MKKFPIDFNINCNSQKLTYHGFLRPSTCNKEKELSFFIRIAPSLSIRLNFNLTGHKKSLNFCIVLQKIRIYNFVACLLFENRNKGLGKLLD